jgi:hypothetical protein
MNMSPMKKTLMALAMVGIVIAAGYFTYVTYVSGDFEAGAPEPKIIIRLTEVATGDTDSVTLNPSRDINAATTITSTLFAVNPNSVYMVEFTISYTITPPAGLPTGTPLIGFSSLSGKKDIPLPHTDINFYNLATGTDGLYPINTPQQPLINYVGTSDFSGLNYRFDRAYNRLSTAPVETIKGEMLGGSVWTLVCHAQTTYAGTGAYSGTTTITINMTLGAENLTVVVSNVAVAITTP